tara:strand:- start:33 stop:377 length:345 start_codon:yes stop_codon:yes gene_type:complete
MLGVYTCCINGLIEATARINHRDEVLYGISRTLEEMAAKTRDPSHPLWKTAEQAMDKACLTYERNEETLREFETCWIYFGWMFRALTHEEREEMEREVDDILLSQPEVMKELNR